jgi:hypothetical protein
VVTPWWCRFRFGVDGCIGVSMKSRIDASERDRRDSISDVRGTETRRLNRRHDAEAGQYRRPGECRCCKSRCTPPMPCRTFRSLFRCVWARVCHGSRLPPPSGLIRTSGAASRSAAPPSRRRFGRPTICDWQRLCPRVTCAGPAKKTRAARAVQDHEAARLNAEP